MDLINRYTGALMGLAVGDSLGMPWEFQHRGTFSPVTDLATGGVHEAEIGEWSDDTSMAMCLAESLIKSGQWDPQDAANRFSQWYRNGYWSCRDHCFDIGNATRSAIETFEYSGDHFAGSTDEFSAGNGSIMRLVPVVMAYYGKSELYGVVSESSRLTHGARACLDACHLMARILIGIFEGKGKDEILSVEFLSVSASGQGYCDEIIDISSGGFLAKEIDQISSSGYVAHTLEAALFCWANTHTYRDAVLMAVNMGDDTDTTAAVVGQIVGAYVGLSGIPSEWQKVILLKEQILLAAEDLYSFNQGNLVGEERPQVVNREVELHRVILGTAIGDSLGLPAEGMSRMAIEKLGWRDNWEQRLLLGRGMISDDTEHTLMVAEALSRGPEDVERFRKSFGSKLKWWLLSLPAGVGMATARSILKLWIGLPASRSGVFSAGNGPAMRSAIIGVYFKDDPGRLESYVRASTEVTHTDPKALVGALAVAYCTAHSDAPEVAIEKMRGLCELQSEWVQLLDAIETALECDITVDEFVNQLGRSKGVSGYVYHTVPVAIYAWLKWHGKDGAFQRTLTDILNCGGDTDSVGAIGAALAATSAGLESIPERWIDELADWPRGEAYIRSAAASLAAGNPVRRVFFPFCFLRNLFFLLVVLSHGLIRLFPVYLKKMIFGK